MPNIVLTYSVSAPGQSRRCGIDGWNLLPLVVLLVLSFVAAVLVLTGLSAAGVSFAWYPTSVLVIPGLVWAGMSAARANWRSFGTGVALVVLGIVGAFAGPAGSWAVAAVGLCLILLADAAAVAWQQHA